MEAYKALAKAQAAMGPALKTATNPHFKKQYADLGAVQEACFDALRSNGFAVYQPVGRDESGPFVKTVFAHESGETLECTVPLLVGKNDMQGLGSAITYARRYGLMSMAGIAPEDDDGNAASKSRQDEGRQANTKPQPNTYALNMSDHSAASFTKAVCDMLKGKGQMEGAKVLSQNDHAISQLSDEMQDEITHAAQIEGVDVKARKAAGAPMREVV